MRRSALVAMLAAACAPAAPPREAQRSSARQQPVSVALERTACFGACPMYTVRLDGSGAVAYEGRRFVREVGARGGRVDADSVRALVAEFERAGFFDFADRYTPGEPTCRMAPTDLPGTVLSVTVGDRAKQVVHYSGCEAAPEALTELARRVDQVAGTADWIGER